MSNIRLSFLLILLTGCLVFSLAGGSHAAIINVSEGESIEAALQSAQPGDEVVVQCGVYFEQGMLMPAGVTLRSDGEDENCVIIETDCTESALICLDLDSDTVIQGITFQTNTSAWPLPEEIVRRGGGVTCSEASPTFINCRFLYLVAYYGGAVNCRQESSPHFFDCQFLNNVAYTTGGMLACVDHCRPHLENCLALNHQSFTDSRETINSAMGSVVLIESCTITRAHFSCWDSSADSVFNSILVFEEDASPPWIGDLSSPSLFECSDLFGPGGLASFSLLPVSLPNSISEDPLFCGEPEGDDFFNLQPGSPCTPEANPLCGLMGAMPVGCTVLSAVDETNDDTNIPVTTRLRDNFPNPFNPRTTIRFDLKQAGPVNLSIYDLSGRLVTVLVNGSLNAGSHQATWAGLGRDGKVVAAGVYFLRFRADGRSDTRRMMMIK